MLTLVNTVNLVVSLSFFCATLFLPTNTVCLALVWGWVVRCLKLGWDVEIIGFKQAISNRWFQLESPTRVGDHGILAVYTLDQFADELISDVA